MNPFDARLLEYYRQQERDHVGDHPRQDLGRYPSDGLVGLQYGREALMASNETISVRPLGGRGGRAVGISAYNKVDPLNDTTVYQNFKGPFVSNTTYAYTEALFIKFGSSVTPTTWDDAPLIRLIGTDTRFNVNNNTGARILSETVNLHVEPAYTNWDASTLTYANAPRNPLLPIDSTAGNSAMWSFGAPLEIGATIDLGTYEETLSPTPVPNPDFRTISVILDPYAVQFNAITFTATQFTITPQTEDWADDDFFNGIQFVVRTRTSPAFTEIGTITDYVGATGTFTYTGLAHTPNAGDSLQFLMPIYGLACWMYLATTMFAGPTIHPLVTWDGIDRAVGYA